MALYRRMNETVQILLIPLLLVWAALVFVMPPALLLSAALRLVLRWNRSAMLLGGAFLLAVPQSVIVLGGFEPANALQYGAIALALAGGVLFWIGTAGSRAKYIWVEAVALTLVAVYLLLGIKWVVG